ncbi:hypothetical protein AB0L57_18210 [Nocardia sp. NPDC052254]|uniref:hypothetical protein n=1 Tax=Nocardia sp. NPDC052254 TaxID=3155681 RepID=UPI0034456B22
MSSPHDSTADSEATARKARPPATIEPSPKRGRWYDTLGWVAITLGGAGIGFAGQGDTGRESAFPTTWVWVASIVLTVLGAWAVLRGRRHLMPVLATLRDLPDDERIVLFLREFKDDPVNRRSIGTRLLWLRTIFVGQPVTAADLHTEEQQIATAVAPFGRMVALGNPSDTLPPPGAARTYAADENWQAEVLDALARSELVVLAAGASRNLAWEVERIVEHGVPSRLVLTVGHDQEKYERFRRTLGDRFPAGLPDHPKPSLRQRVLKAYSVRAVIRFDDDWTPHLAMLAGRVPILDFARRTQRTMRRALTTVFVRAGLPPRVTPTLPRPAAVPTGIALILAVWTLPVLLLTVLLRFFEVAGSALFASDSLTSAAGPVFTIVLVALASVCVITIPWMWRVWRGGPLAIGFARIWGVWFALALTAFLLSPLHKAPEPATSDTSISITHWDFSDDSTHDDPFEGDSPEGYPFVTDSSDDSTKPVRGGWPETLPLLLLTVLLSGFPVGATVLLTRREVRQWVDSRL